MPYSSPDNSSLETLDHEEDIHRKDAQTDKMETCLKQPSFQLCKPLILTMTVFGLLHLNGKNLTAGKRVSSISKAYSAVLLLLLWLNFFRLFLAYSLTESFGPALFMKIALHVWSLECAINCTVNFKACRYVNRLSEFLMRWQELTRINRSSNLDLDDERSDRSYSKFMSRRFLTSLFIGWILFLLNMIFVSCMLFATSIFDILLVPMPSDHRYMMYVKAISLVGTAYLTASWIFTLCLFFMTCGVIYKEFEILDQDFRAAISTEGEIPRGVECFRRRHQAICRIVETADDTLNVFNSTGLALNMCIGMLELYNLVWYYGIFSDTLVLVSNIFWLVTSLAYVSVIAFGGGYLNHVAHAPLKYIHDIRVDRSSAEFAMQMNMFLNKLTGESIGLTAMDMFVIDKPTNLTIAGAFITYFIILIQFQQPTGSTECSSMCNCTEIFLNSTLQCSAML